MDLEFWFIDHAGDQLGPVGKDVLVKLIKNGTIERNTEIWTSGMEGWLAADQVDQISLLFDREPRPSPPAAQPPMQAPAEVSAVSQTNSLLKIIAGLLGVMIIGALIFFFGQNFSLNFGPGEAGVKAAMKAKYENTAGTWFDVVEFGKCRKTEDNTALFECKYRAKVTVERPHALLSTDTTTTTKWVQSIFEKSNNQWLWLMDVNYDPNW